MALLHSQLLLLIEPLESLITAMVSGGYQEERIEKIARDMARIAQALNLLTSPQARKAFGGQFSVAP